MTTIEEHRKIIKEFIRDINEKIRSNLFVERQKLIGFSASEAVCNMFALFLHKRNLISPGFNVNHRFFTSEKIAEEKFGFDFPDKGKIITFIVKQENFRILLCYGKTKERRIVEEAIKNMFDLKKIIENLIGEEL